VPTSTGQILGRLVPKNPIEGFVIVRLPSGNLKVIATDAIGRNPIFDVPLGKGQMVGRRIGWREITR
jgi:type IV pilus assembly protein PilY1